MSRRWPPLLLPLLLLLAVTIIFRFTGADLAISRLFYGGPEVRWPLRRAQPWVAVYQFGIYPGWALAAAGLLVVLIGLFCERLRRWRRGGLFLVLTLALGPGLIVNLVKDHWRRPRPCQVIPFGGRDEFLPIGTVGGDDTAHSFPSGHASMGFYLMAPAFLLRRRHPRLALAFLLLGVCGGGVVGLGRVVQGKHFASDILWSAGFVYFSGLAAYFLLRLGHTEAAKAPAKQPVDADESSFAGREGESGGCRPAWLPGTVPSGGDGSRHASVPANRVAGG